MTLDNSFDSRRDSRIAILDSAEALFAERGYFGVSVRDITEHADVRLASVNYHFRTKEKLFREVVTRRAAVVSEDRRKLLADIGGPAISREERPTGWQAPSSCPFSSGLWAGLRVEELLPPDCPGREFTTVGIRCHRSQLRPDRKGVRECAGERFPRERHV